MARILTDTEKAVLGHVVIDPEGWWDHAVATPKVNAELALAEKVARWEPSYDAATEKVRADRAGEEPAVFVERPDAEEEEE